MAEAARLPAGLLDEIIAIRAYARTKHAYDDATAEDVKAMPKTYWLRLVQRIEHDFAVEEIEKRG